MHAMLKNITFFFGHHAQPKRASATVTFIQLCMRGRWSRECRHGSHAWSSIRSLLLRLLTGSDFAPARLPAPDPVLHVSAPERRGAVTDARLGLA